jgi:hypothetical protein
MPLEIQFRLEFLLIIILVRRYQTEKLALRFISRIIRVHGGHGQSTLGFIVVLFQTVIISSAPKS